MTRREFSPKLDAIREALIVAGAALMTVAEEEVDEEVEISLDDADCGLGMLTDAWNALELPAFAGDYISLALSRFESENAR